MPDGYEVVEYIDNGEFIAAAVIDIPVDKCPDFIKTNHFISVPFNFEISFYGQNYINKENQNFPKDYKQLVFIDDCKGGNSWYYLLDKQTGRLWCQITYPDWGGTAQPCDDTAKGNALKIPHP
ncbi:MAG: hypothetical protein V2A54_17410 [Bacteroidota bacterium]